MVQMSSIPEKLAALIQVFFQNPGHTFDATEIHGVTQELVKSIPALSLSMHNDPLDLIDQLLIWLQKCCVKIAVVVQHTDSCEKCPFKNESCSPMPNIFALPLIQKHESLTCFRTVNHGR